MRQGQMTPCPAIAILTLTLDRDRLADYAATCDRQILAVGRINQALRERMRAVRKDLLADGFEPDSWAVTMLEDKETK